MGHTAKGVKDIETYDEHLLKAVKHSLVSTPNRNPTTTIYALPETMVHVQPEAYRVRIVRLGLGTTFPWENLQQLHAPSHVLSILVRNPSRKFEDYVMAMYEMRDEIRTCHFPAINMDFQLFVHGVFSGCHIVDNMLNFYEGKLTPDVDHVCSGGLPYIWVDYLLVENQIPFCILQKIYDMAIVDYSRYPPLAQLCLRFYEQFLNIDMPTPPLESGPVHHLLHLLHQHLLPSTAHSNPPSLLKSFCSILITPKPQALPLTTGGIRIKPVPSARRLQIAGIKLKKKSGPGITFHRGILEIPYLRVDTNTKPFLLNMAAWEQVHPHASSYFTSFVILMDYLINTKEDVEILNDCGIIEQSLGSGKEAAKIFHGLSRNIAYNGGGDDFLPHLCEDLNRFYNNKYRRWWTRLLNDYFNSPWAIISVIAGIYLLIVTSLQTVYTIYPYYRPSS